MLTYLCRCCAAPLEIKQGATVCRCSYCDVLQTLPRLDHDEKAQLWERADALRRSAEYDRAMALYQQLAELDSTDPDAYWCMTLCRYGVEYVEEQGSRRRVPTLNRIQYAPVIDDEDYRRATRLADNDQRRLYMEEAMRLEELRRATIEVSMTEQPYDIFICYKETDSKGRRTEDSVIAGQLYRAFSAEGWRVFFARVSLEEKAGTVFEPYIFAALNSARMMFAVGTSPENFNAVWVRNEWSRYLFRLSEKGGGELVVLYKNMLPEHLPEEFAHLQRYDMSAPDVMEDLLRGARKVLSTGAVTAEEQAEEQVEGVTAETLLRRAELALEDREFQNAYTFCERALDAQPENAMAYVYKLLAEFGVSKTEQLADVTEDIGASGSYKKAVRFADEQLKAQLNELRCKAMYRRYCSEYQHASNDSQFRAIAERFATLGDYLDSAEYVQRCIERAVSIGRANSEAESLMRYTEAKKLYDMQSCMDSLIHAKNMFESLGEYKDSVGLAQRCGERIAYLAEQQRQMAQQETLLDLQNEQTKQSMKLVIGLVAAMAVMLIISLIVALSMMNEEQEGEAMSLSAEHSAMFSDIGDDFLAEEI